MFARRPLQAITCLIRHVSRISIQETSKISSTICVRSPTEPIQFIASSNAPKITFLPREISLDIGQSRRNPLLPRKEIVDLPLVGRIIQDPILSRIGEIGDIPSNLPAVDLPQGIQSTDDTGIQAARLIVIRRRKMRKHKLRKLRKKMKYEWAKVRQRRELRKEKAFQAELIAQIKEAERFSAEAYVTDKLRRATETPIPRFWKGKRLPQFIIKQKLGLD